jgi:ABC-type branched-subunit amino acid transport system ATPase component
VQPIVELQQAGSGSLRAVDLVVAPGERLGVAGAPGSGKSALIELLAGARRPDRGRVRRDGIDVTDRPGAAEGRGVGWVAQRPRPFRNLTVFENVLAVALANPNWNSRVAEAHARRAVVRVGLTAAADQPASLLDSTTAKRLEVARVLASPQRLVLVDQLSDGLDPATRVELTEALSHATAEGAALVWADLIEAPPVAVDRLVVLALGRIEAEGSPERILASPLVRHLRQSVSGPTSGRSQAAHSGATGRANAASTARPGTGGATSAAGPAPAPDAALVVAHWTAPAGEVPVVSDVSFSVDAGEFVVVWGRAGSGKSVLLRSLAGLVRADGDLTVAGRDLSGLASFQRSRMGLRIVPQRGGYSPGVTVTENLALARDLGRGGTWSIPLVFDHFPGLYDGRDRPAADLAELERRALAIGCALLSQPKVLLVDEVTGGLPARSADLLLDRLSELTGSLVCVMAERPALGVASRTAHLEQGRWYEESRRVFR